MNKDEIKSLYMRAADGDLNEVEQAYLNTLLESDQNMDVLAELQREQVMLSDMMTQRSQHNQQQNDMPQTLDENFRNTVLAHAALVHAQTVSEEKENSSEITKTFAAPVKWLLAQRLAAACLVGSLIWGTISIGQVTYDDSVEAKEEPIRVADIEASPRQERAGFVGFMGDSYDETSEREGVNGRGLDDRRYHYSRPPSDNDDQAIGGMVNGKQKLLKGDSDVNDGRNGKLSYEIFDHVSPVKDFPIIELPRWESVGENEQGAELELTHNGHVGKSIDFKINIKLKDIEGDENNLVSILRKPGESLERPASLALSQRSREELSRSDAGKIARDPSGSAGAGEEINLPDKPRELTDEYLAQADTMLGLIDSKKWEYTELRKNDSGKLRQDMYADSLVDLSEVRRQQELVAAERARERRDYDQAIVHAKRALKDTPEDEHIARFIAETQKERHTYLDVLTADAWDEKGLRLDESINEETLPIDKNIEAQVHTLSKKMADKHSKTQATLVHIEKEKSALKPQESQPPQKKSPSNYPVNPWVMTDADALSTFSIDTDTASYAIARNYIQRGYLPPAGIVRMEEFINAFDYNYARTGVSGITARASAAANVNSYKTFTVHRQVHAAPYGSDNNKELQLLKIGVKGKVIGREQRKVAHIVLAVDTSGSMDQADRLPLIQHAVLQLLHTLDKRDRVTLIAYGQQARLLLEAEPLTNAAHLEKITKLIQSLQCDGSTDVRQGLQLAYEIAARHFKAGQVNRVVLCSDGVANVGETVAENMLTSVRAYKQQGISCTTVGVGQGVYNDHLLERLANNGDGNYVYVGSQKDAEQTFVQELSASLQYIAQDVKIQVEFDPSQVRRYRLIGYENRAIADTDFRNDSVDAGELASGHSVTALYEIELQPMLDGRGEREVKDLGTIFLRWKDIASKKVLEDSYRVQRQTINTSANDGNGDNRQKSMRANPRFYLAAIAAEFAEILRMSEHVGNASNASHVESNRGKKNNFMQLRKDISTVAAQLPLDQKVQELKSLVFKAQGLPRAR